MIFVIHAGTQATDAAIDVLRAHRVPESGAQVHEVIVIGHADEISGLIRERPNLVQDARIVFESVGDFTGRYLRHQAGFEKRKILIPPHAQLFERPVALRPWREACMDAVSGLDCALRQVCGCKNHKPTRKRWRTARRQRIEERMSPYYA